MKVQRRRNDERMEPVLRKETRLVYFSGLAFILLFPPGPSWTLTNLDELKLEIEVGRREGGVKGWGERRRSWWSVGAAEVEIGDWGISLRYLRHEAADFGIDFSEIHVYWERLHSRLQVARRWGASSCSAFKDGWELMRKTSSGLCRTTWMVDSWTWIIPNSIAARMIKDREESTQLLVSLYQAALSHLYSPHILPETLTPFSNESKQLHRLNLPLSRCSPSVVEDTLVSTTLWLLFLFLLFNLWTLGFDLSGTS